MTVLFETLPIWSWVTLLLVPPLIFLLYFLKLRRTSVEVPSTYLWAKTIEDLHVNSFWQRLRKNILLLLQLLFALMLLLACLRPGCDGQQLTEPNYIFLIDNSSSMSATDSESGLSRLEIAKRETRDAIDRLPASSSAMLISFSDAATVVQSYTSNKAELYRKLDTIQQTRRSSDLEEALTAAAGLANPGRTSDKESSTDVQVADALEATVFIFSDGGVRKLPKFDQGALEIEYHAIGAVDTPPVNVGITAFSVSDPADTETGTTQLYGRLQNSSGQEQTVSVSLFIDEQLHEAEANIVVPANGSKGVSFDLDKAVSEVDDPVTVRLEIDQDDVYLFDNRAFCVLNPPRKSNVLIVTDDTPYFQLACQTDSIKKRANVDFRDSSFLEEPIYRDRAATAHYDLAMFDNVRPKLLPRCNTVFWNAVPDDQVWKREAVQSPTPIFDFDGSHPLMAAVGISSVTVINSTDLEGPKGSLSLIESKSGSIAMLGPRDSYLDLVMGFSIVELNEDGSTSVNTDWPKKLSFPIFMQNIMTQLGGSAGFASGQNVSPGNLLRIKPTTPYEKLTVTSPGGDQRRISPQENKTFVYGTVNEVGIYQIADERTDALDQLIPVNLFDPIESNLTVRDSLTLGYTNLKRVVSTVEKRHEFWPYLLWLALAILMIEWIVYNRRVLI